MNLKRIFNKEMITRNKLLILLLLIFNGYNQHIYAASGTASITLENATSYSISAEEQALSFGTITNSHNRTIQINPKDNGSKECSAGTCQGATKMAKFTISGGDAGTSSPTITISNISNLTADNTDNNKISNQVVIDKNYWKTCTKFDENQECFLHIGGKLTINQGQATGNYTGTYTVTVAQ